MKPPRPCQAVAGGLLGAGCWVKLPPHVIFQVIDRVPGAWFVVLVAVYATDGRKHGAAWGHIFNSLQDAVARLSPPRPVPLPSRPREQGETRHFKAGHIVTCVSQEN